MAKFLTAKADSSLTLLRWILGIVMVSHGAMRIYHHQVDGLRDFFLAHKIPQPVLVAWAFTVLEIAAGIIFFLGKFVKPIGFIFAAGLTAGIYFLYTPSAWLLVNAERTGLEYTVVLLTAFIAVALSKTSWK